MRLERRKLQEREKRKITALLVLVAFILTLFPTGVFAADVTSKLINLTVEAKQDGVVIGDSDWGNVDIEKEIKLKFSFQVPVKGDGKTDPDIVHHGDNAQISIAKGLDLVGAVGPFDLVYGGKKVGTLTITGDSTELFANIAFDGDEDIFTSAIENWSDVKIDFTATLKYERDPADIDGSTQTIYVLGKTFTLTVPPLPYELEGEKTGVRDGQYINWKVKIKEKHNRDLNGYEFRDDITAVGEYVPGTLKVNNIDAIAIATAVVPDFLSADTSLAYTFPSGSTGEHFIYFQTKIKDDVFNSNGDKTITNQAKMFKGSTEWWEDSDSVTFTVEWITKTGAEHYFDPVSNTGKIIWTITANTLSESLENVYIEDVLDSKLTFESAEWFKDANKDGVWVSQGSISPDVDSKYSLGNINTPVQLKITTEVKSGSFNIGHEIQNITNSAKIFWTGGPGSGVGTGGIDVPIGLNPIEKLNNSLGKDKPDIYDKTDHSVPWEVLVKKSDVAENLRVMDLLVYANSDFNVDNIGSTYQIDDNDTDTTSLKYVSDADFKKLTPSYNQKYKTLSFNSTDGLEMVKYIIKDGGGKAVADLLVVTDAGGNGIDVNGGAKSFNFESIVTNPDIYAKNGSTTIKNTASLFSKNNHINRDEDQINYISTILAKDMLPRDKANNPDANKNAAKASLGLGYNYVDNTIVYRLHINANELTDFANDLTTVDEVKPETFTLQDILPAGWEFVVIDGSDKFLIYEGTGNSDGTVTAGSAPADTSFLTADFATSGVANFTFTNITKPYVILLKAKVTDADVLAGYFDGNKTTKITNNAKLTATNWTSGSSAIQDENIVSKVLDKTMLSVGGVLVWTVEYKPAEIGHTGAKIEDVLSPGIELRTDSEGELDLTGDNITVKELILQSDGTYAVGSDVALVLGPSGNISYDVINRTLTFVIPPGATEKGYRVVYKTDVVSDPGATITNKVSLVGSTINPGSINKPYVVKDAEANATMTRSGWIEIVKQDYSTKTPLVGATFEVITAGGNVFRTGTTGADGKLTLRGLPEGSYTLKEVTSPAGYNTLPTIFSILITKDAGVIVSSIDGKTGAGSNKITIDNIKTGTLGGLKVSKILSGNATDKNKDFQFTVKLVDGGLALTGTYDYVGHGGKSDGTLTFNASGEATFTLKGNQGITILNLPKDYDYTVTEADYSADGYSTINIKNDTGKVVADDTIEAEFTNYKHKSGGGTVDPPKDPDPEKDKDPEKEEDPEKDKDPEDPKGPIEEETEKDTPKDGEVPKDPEDKVEVEKEPENGKVEIDENGKWTYTPDPGFTGKDEFIIKVIHPDGTEEEFYIIIDVDDVPLGAPELPKTGVNSRLPQYVAGLLFIAAGLLLRRSFSR